MQVTIKNNTRLKSFALTLAETTTGGTTYVGIFNVVTVANEDIFTGVDLGANDGDTILVIDNISPNPSGFVRPLTVDAKKPTIADLVPVDNTITRAQAVTFTGKIMDTGSGIVADLAKNSSGTTPEFDNGEIQVKVGPSGGTLVDRTSLANWTKVTDGFSFSLLLFISEGEHDWQVTADDLVANTKVTDSDPVKAGDQPNDLEIDTRPPTLAAAVTGKAWDAAKGQIKSNVANSIQTTFTNGSGGGPDKLDAATLQTSDFLVGDPGANPIAIVFPNLAPGATGNNTGTGTLPGGQTDSPLVQAFIPRASRAPLTPTTPT